MVKDLYAEQPKTGIQIMMKTLKENINGKGLICTQTLRKWQPNIRAKNLKDYRSVRQETKMLARSSSERHENRNGDVYKTLKTNGTTQNLIITRKARTTFSAKVEAPA